MKLLSGKELNNVKFPGIIKHEHIYNDYHTRNTNPGFSRGELGRMFSKWFAYHVLSFAITTHSYHIFNNILVVSKIKNNVLVKIIQQTNKHADF